MFPLRRSRLLDCLFHAGCSQLPHSTMGRWRNNGCSQHVEISDASHWFPCCFSPAGYLVSTGTGVASSGTTSPLREKNINGLVVARGFTAFSVSFSAEQKSLFEGEMGKAVLLKIRGPSWSNATDPLVSLPTFRSGRIHPIAIPARSSHFASDREAFLRGDAVRKTKHAFLPVSAVKIE